MAQGIRTFPAARPRRPARHAHPRGGDHRGPDDSSAGKGQTWCLNHALTMKTVENMEKKKKLYFNDDFNTKNCTLAKTILFRQRPWQLRLKRPKLHSLKTIVIKRSLWMP
jgi:hypothetical protein